ncbi:glycosyl hydrolase family 28-related protein [Kiritimatiella glycovorans]|uniref:Rhamnogalacturonase A/B/Epimerase-like pectate lyase domain-containing protein n=1 Tax=Kiritimatiella glycovorans TaxID=1307763 RepID=A0A0G3EAH2_9BACT|nr:glycosyl hydrolase family 28-related protein [Kiritimatiella glycovorans]AKJ63441.1 hypothetical protein L21SP4_00157 [Kiritimatiella glycovorans]
MSDNGSMTRRAMMGAGAAGFFGATARAAAAEGSAPLAPRQAFSVRDFGAKGDGASDDSGAFQKALDRAVHAGNGAIYVPAGHYRIGRRVSAEATLEGLALLGDGQNVSSLICDHEEGVFRLHDHRCLTAVTVRDLSFFADRPAAGTALEISSPPRGARNYRTLLVENVDIRGFGVPSRSYFTRGIDATGQWRPLFMNVIVSGISDPGYKRGDRSDDAPSYAAEVGIVADWCYAPSFQHCYVWSQRTGYRIVNRGREQGPEDSAFYRSNAVGCVIGMDIETPIFEPQLVIESCHINCRDVGVWLKNRKFFQLTNNLMYGQDGTDFPYVDFLLHNAYSGTIIGNVFQSPEITNYREDPPADHTMIELRGRTRHLLISHNVLNAKGRMLKRSGDMEGLIVKDNLASNPHVEMDGHE